MSDVSDRDLARIGVSLEARFTKFEKALARIERETAKHMGGVEKALKGPESQMRKLENASMLSFGRIASSAAKFAGVFGVGFLGAQAAADVGRYAAQYRDLQNALKVAGLEGDALKATFADLSRISLAQGAPLDALVTLYSRASQSATELNASQAELIQFSDGIATALRVAGTSAGEAQGALLQLSQALGGGIVRAEEFNSINEGARPILQAVANGLKEAGGSVSQLRAIVLEGKLSSEAFFRAFLASSEGLREQASRAEGTISQSFSRIGTAMMLLVGHLDETSGASSNAAAGLDHVASAIQALPGYIDAALGGLASLESYLNSMGNASIFKQINDFLGLSSLPEWYIEAQGVERVRPGARADDRVSSAFDVTAGTGAAEIDKGGRVTAPPPPRQVSLSDFTLPGASGSSGGRDSRTAAAAKAEREAKAVTDLITTLEREKSLIGATDLEREISNALREAGAAATDVQKARITDLVTAIDAETKALERQKDAQEVLHNVASDTLHGIADGLRNGADAGDILKGVLDDLADKLADMAINSLFSGSTGSLFGGGGGFLGTSAPITLWRTS